MAPTPSERKQGGAGGGTKATVLLVDDHPVVRHGLARFIDKEPDLAVCGEADDAHAALDAIERLRPDVVVADLSLKGRPGLELVKDIDARFPGLPVLVLSMHDEGLWAERVLRAGARGYIMKQEATEQVVNALRRVLRGEVWVSPAMSSRLLQRLSKARPAAAAAAAGAGSPLESLTDRELVVFQLIGLGLGTREVAERLSISVKTAETHRENIKAKLNLRGGTELLRYAILHALDDQ